MILLIELNFPDIFISIIRYRLALATFVKGVGGSRDMWFIKIFHVKLRNF